MTPCLSIQWCHVANTHHLHYFAPNEQHVSTVDFTMHRPSHCADDDAIKRQCRCRFGNELTNMSSPTRNDVFPQHLPSDMTKLDKHLRTMDMDSVKYMLHGKVSFEVPLPCGLATPAVMHWQSKFGLQLVPRHRQCLHAPCCTPPETSF